MTLRRRLLPPVLALALLVPACSSGSSPSPSVAAGAPSPSLAAPAESTDPGTSVAAATPQPSVDTSVIDAWRASASVHRGMNGERFDYDCPPGGEPSRVWGTDIYTDDSSVCTAAVHVGLITLDEGGTVTIEIRPGEDSYEASERNGIETSPYPAWGGSFVVDD